MVDCELCTIITEEFRLIRKTKHSFAIICEQPIKAGHIMILPKRHVTQDRYSELTPEESQDFLALVEDMQHLVTSKYNEDVMLFKNSNSHSTQSHFHVHLVPSKGNMRKLISALEDIPTHPERAREYYTTMKKFLIDI